MKKVVETIFVKDIKLKKWTNILSHHNKDIVNRMLNLHKKQHPNSTFVIAKSQPEYSENMH